MVGAWVFDHLGLLQSGRWRTLARELVAHSRRDRRPILKIARDHLLKPLVPGFARRRRRAAAPRIPPWIRPEFAQRVGLSDIMRHCRPQPNVTGTARAERYRLVFSYPSVRIVQQLERSRARLALGFADPWSDRRIASFLLAVPQWVVQQVREPKRLARRAMRGIMPEAVRQKAGKIEPGALYQRGLLDRGRTTVEALIRDSEAARRGFVDEDALSARYTSLLRREPPRFDFWCPLALEMWLRRHGD
jgi:asparagine synthase (glutamine-hydrolysing)